MTKLIKVVLRIFFILVLSLAVGCTTTEPEDKIPPGKITDLRVERIDYFGAEIIFTAPGDDLYSGKALRFDVRYSTDQKFSFSPERYFEAIGKAVPEAPEPPPAGEKVRIFVKNLEPKTRYFLGIRVYDEVGNFSDVSNIVEFSTPDAPGTSGEVVGYIPNILHNTITSDGKRVYLLFPGLYLLEETEETFRISPIREDIPPIQGAQVVWDGEKFISIGGNIGGELVQNPLAIYPDGRIVIMQNEGELIPFGPNGFFGYGVMNHKIAKLGNGFAVIGGVKFFSERIDVAVREKKLTKIGMEKIPFFIPEKNKLIWSLIYPKATTYPFSTLDPAIINFDNNTLIVWGGNSSESSILPTSNASRLLFPKDTTNFSANLKWESYNPFSGYLPKIYNTCEAQSQIKTLKIKYLEEIPEEIKEVKEEDIPNLTKGEVFLYQGRAAEVEDEKYDYRTFIIGRFREGAREFAGIYGVFSDGEREIFVKLKPTIGREEFRLPDISIPCRAQYFGDKLFILHGGNIYIIKFKNYQIVEE